MEALPLFHDNHHLTGKPILTENGFEPVDETFRVTATAVEVLELKTVSDTHLKKYLEAMKYDLQQLKTKLTSHHPCIKLYEKLPPIFENFALNICHLNKVSSCIRSGGMPSMNCLMNILLIIKDFVELCEKNNFTAVEPSLKNIVSLNFSSQTWIPSMQKSMIQKSLDKVQESYIKMQTSFKGANNGSM